MAKAPHAGDAIRPPSVTRGREGLADLRSNSRKGGLKRVDCLPAAYRQSQYLRDEIEPEVPRRTRDMIRKNRRCSAYNRGVSARRPMIPARFGRRGGKVQRPAPQYRWARPNFRMRRGNFARRPHRQRRCRATAARTASTPRQIRSNPGPYLELYHHRDFVERPAECRRLGLQ